MKNTILTLSVAAGLFAATVAASLAASITLTNGGLGQVAAQPQQFGVAVCNGGTASVNQSVPVTVSANGQNQSILSASVIEVGDCEYTYLPYSEFNMQGGKTYTVNVTIDAQHTVIANTNNATSYSVTVPSQVAANPMNNQTADVSAQVSSNPFVAFWNWLIGLFRGL